jgi:hypothetical protein
MSGTKNTRVQISFQAWGKQGYTLWPHRKRFPGMGRAADIVSGFVDRPSGVIFFGHQGAYLNYPEELCQQKGASWERGTGERVEEAFW